MVCEHNSSNGERYCHICGSKKNFITCLCGHENSANNIYCGSCGQKINKKNSNDELIPDDILQESITKKISLKDILNDEEIINFLHHSDAHMNQDEIERLLKGKQ